MVDDDEDEDIPLNTEERRQKEVEDKIKLEEKMSAETKYIKTDEYHKR